LTQDIDLSTSKIGHSNGSVRGIFLMGQNFPAYTICLDRYYHLAAESLLIPLVASYISDGG
ncbi:MAG: hypothetical protein J7497_14205, partial [Chitinophagaceae bacterium]|nr:hypothetical protein [Chitinophagaceae bacterium]